MNRLTEEREEKQLISSFDEQKTQSDRSKEPEPETAEDIAKQVCIASKMNFRTGKGNGICASRHNLEVMVIFFTVGTRNSKQ